MEVVWRTEIPLNWRQCIAIETGHRVLLQCLFRRWKIMRGNKIIFASVRYSVLPRNRYRTSSPPDDWFRCRLAFLFLRSGPQSMGIIISLLSHSRPTRTDVFAAEVFRFVCRHISINNLSIKYLCRFYIKSVVLYNLTIVFMWTSFLSCCVHRCGLYYLYHRHLSVS